MNEDATGSVSALIAACDWAATPLGPPAAWPPSLRTVVDLIAASPLAMAVLWGEALIQIPNAAFLRQADETAAVGGSARCAGPASPIDRRLCDRALAGEATIAERRHGETRLALAYSALRDESGAIAGVLVTATPAQPAQTGNALVRLMSEERARLAIAASATGAWAWDARSNEATWDECYHAMYGFEPDAPRTHEAWLGRLHPEDRDRVVARLAAVRHTPGDDEWDIEFRAVVPGRGIVWMQGLGRAVRDADGTLRSMTGINLDITGRKQVEQRLRASEEQLRLFFAYAPAAAAMFDREMRYIAASRRWLSDFGLPADITGRSHYDVLPEIPAHWRAIHRRCLAGAVEVSEEDRFERADGSVQWLKWQVHPWRSDVGEIGGIIIVSEDITDARRWRERQQVLVGELQHRTRNLITVVESIAQQTVRGADSLAAFLAQFSARLRSLGRVQSLLSRADRQPITIEALIHMELAALGADAGGARTVVAGPEVRLRKRDVQTFALAIHELATNACKYGALAAERGRLSVTWQVENGPGAPPQLALEWAESGIEQPFGGAAPRPGYGWTLIESGLSYSLSAQTSLELRADAFRCSIRLAVEDSGVPGPYTISGSPGSPPH